MYDNSFSKDYSPMVNILSGEPNISKKYGSITGTTFNMNSNQ